MPTNTTYMNNTHKKFTLIKNFNKNIVGDILTTSDGENYFFDNDADKVKYPIHFVLANDDLFKEVPPSLDIASVIETNDNTEDETIYDWRIELKVKCSKKTLMEIESLIRSTISPLLG